MFIRTENFRTFTRLYPIVTTILAINLGIYLIYLIGFQLLHLLPIGQAYTYLFGSNIAVIYGHQWWRLVTPMFLHFQFQHVLFNCFTIFLFAPALEAMLGKWKFSIAYFGSGIISNVLALFYGGIDQLPYLGASAAIFGLFGLFLFIIIMRRNLIDRQSSQIITIILIANVVWTFISPKVDISGHFFGFLAGFLLGPILLAKTNPNWYRK